MQKFKLDYQTAIRLRRVYGMYKDLRRKDFISKSDTPEERAEGLADYEAARTEIQQDLLRLIAESGLKVELYNLEDIIYSKNQLKFIEDAELTNFELYYGYSGRGMFGDVCPALYCDSHNDITTRAKTKIDSMGLGIVIYAQY